MVVCPWDVFNYKRKKSVKQLRPRNKCFHFFFFFYKVNMWSISWMNLCQKWKSYHHLLPKSLLRENILLWLQIHRKRFSWKAMQCVQSGAIFCFLWKNLNLKSCDTNHLDTPPHLTHEATHTPTHYTQIVTNTPNHQHTPQHTPTHRHPNKYRWWMSIVLVLFCFYFYFVFICCFCFVFVCVFVCFVLHSLNLVRNKKVRSISFPCNQP